MSESLCYVGRWLRYVISPRAERELDTVLQAQYTKTIEQKISTRFSKL